jgi:hypothetical protein
MPCLRCREDALPQASYVRLDLAPVHAVPVEQAVLRSVRHATLIRDRGRGWCGRGVQLVPRF